jgi:hypothetical protein
MPNTTVVKDACQKISELSFQDPVNTYFIFYNLDSAAYRAIDCEGNMIPARQLDGKYHLDADLAIVPKELFIKTLKICLPLFQLAPDVNKFILSPSPRYWLTKCCEDDEHMPNFTSDGFEDEMFTGLSNLRRIIKDFIFMNRVPKVKVINPFLVFADSTGRSIGQEAIDSVRDVWGPDPVHPSLECMEKLSSFLVNVASGEDTESVISSVTTTPASQPKAKRLRWACETPSPFVSPSSSRARGAVGHRGGQRGWGGRGGRGGRGWGHRQRGRPY